MEFMTDVFSMTGVLPQLKGNITKHPGPRGRSPHLPSHMIGIPARLRIVGPYRAMSDSPADEPE